MVRMRMQSVQHASSNQLSVPVLLRYPAPTHNYAFAEDYNMTIDRNSTKIIVSPHDILLYCGALAKYTQLNTASRVTGLAALVTMIYTHVAQF